MRDKEALTVDEQTLVELLAVTVQAGVPVLMVSPPGDGKTSLGAAVLEAYGFRIIELVGADMPPERITGFPVPSGERIRYVPDELLAAVFSGEAVGINLSDVASMPPESVNAILEFVRRGLLGGKTPPRLIPLVMSTNPPEHLAEGTTLSKAFLNRVMVVHFEPSPLFQARALTASLARLEAGYAPPPQGGFFRGLESEGWRSFLNLPPLLEGEEGRRALREGAEKVIPLLTAFIEGEGYKYDAPPEAEFRPFYSRRALTLGGEFLTTYFALKGRGWKPKDESRLLSAGLYGLMGPKGLNLAVLAQRSEVIRAEDLLRDPALFARLAEKHRGPALAQTLLSVVNHVKRQKAAGGDVPLEALGQLLGLALEVNREVGMSFYASLRKAGVEVAPPALLKT